MQRQDSEPRSRQKHHDSAVDSPPPSSQAGFNIQKELNLVEEIVLDSPRIPLTRWTLIDEDKLLNQLDLVRIKLPDAFEKALEVLQRQQSILQEAEAYAHNIIDSAQRRSAQILDETGIVQRAEREALQIQQQVQRECEAIHQRTMAEITQLRNSAQQELEQLRQTRLVECEQIQQGADQYADAALNQLEQQLGEIMRIVRNGRHQIRETPSQVVVPRKRLPENSR